MANQITINIGAAANDGTGDPLRTAFNDVNLNFANVWNTGLPSSNVQFSDNRILTVNTNANLVLAPNGIGIVQSNVDIIPSINRGQSLGSNAKKWNTVNSYYINADVANVGSFGNLTVAVANLHITGGSNGYVLQTDGAGNLTWTAQTGGSGNGTPGGANTQVQFNDAGSFGGSAAFTFNKTSNVLAINGNISAGNASIANLTSTGRIYGTTGTFTGDQFSDGALYVGNPAGTVLGSDVVIQITANSGSYSQTNFQNINSGVRASSDYIITADNGNDTTHFIDLGMTSSNWDGSETNALANLAPNNGYLYVQDGDLTLGTRTGNTSYGWTFDTNGGLTFPGNTFAEDDIEGTGNFGFETPANVGFGILTNAGSQEWSFGTNGTLTLAGDITATPVGFPFTGAITNITTGNPTVIVDLGNSPFGAPVTGKVLIEGVVGTTEANEVWYYQAVEANQFQLFNDAACTIPVDGTSWTAYSGGGTAYASAYDSMAISTGGLQVVAGSSSWYFGMDGNLNLAGGITSDSTIVIDNRDSGNSADIQLYAADDILLQARDRTPGSGSEGGDINIYAGDSAEDGDASGGDVTIEAGNGGAANVDNGGSGGFIAIRAGYGGDASTQVGGLSARGGGSLSLNAGGAGSNMGNIDRGANGGDVTISAGDSTGNNSNGGEVSINTGGGGANALSGGLYINIPESGQGPGGSWIFDGTGTTFSVPANSSIYGANFGNFTVGCAGNTIVTSSNYGANVKNWVFGSTGDLTAPGNIITPTNFIGTNLRTNLTDFNWSDPIVGITLGANTYVTLDNLVFGDPWSGQVTISGVSGTTEANGNWYYVAADANVFELRTNGGADPVDSSEWGTYTGGGIAYTLGYNNLEINAQNITIRSDHGDYNNKIWRFNSNGFTVFPYMDTVRGDTTGGNITGYTLRMGDGTAEAIITTPDGDPTGGQSSQRLVINPGKGADGTSGEGGDIYLWAGRGGDAGGSGGDIKIRGGQGMGEGGAGGYIRMEAGDGDNAGGYPGYIEITGGQGGISQPGGYVRITGGTGYTVGGDANITGGYGSNGSGGNVNIFGGTSGLGGGSYGNVNIYTGNTGNIWTFNRDGNLRLPQGGVINEGPSPSFLGDAVTITPANGSDADQQLKIYPTFVEGNHLHLTTGNLYNTEMYVGDDNLYVKLANTGNIQLQANDNVGNLQQWTFGTDGVLNLPYEGILQSTDDTVTLRTFNTTTGNANSVYLGTSGGLGFFDQAIGGNWLEIFRSGTDPQIATPGNLLLRTDSTNTAPTWTFGANGNLTAPGSIVTAGGSGGNISGANVIGANTFVASGNITGGNLITAAASNVILGNAGSYVKQADSNARINLAGSVTLAPDTNADANNGVIIGGNGYLLSPNGSRNAVLNYGGDSGSMGIYSVNVYGNTVTAITNGGQSGRGNIGANSTNRFNTAFLTAVDATGNITGGNLIATANVLSNGYARLTGGFDESQASTAGLYLGYAGGTARIMFGTGNTSQTLEIDNDGGTLRFYKPGTTLASLTNSGNFSATGNVSGANIIASANVSVTGRVLVGNGSASVPSYAFTSDGAIDTGFYWVSDGNIGVTNNGVQTAQFLPDGVFRQIPRTVGTLPSASSVGAGARAFCTDLNSTTFGNLAVGGGGTYMPVFSNGTNWYIG